MDELLFHTGDLRASLEQEAKKVNKAVEEVPEEHAMQADADEWAAAIVEEVWVHGPELKLEDVWQDEPEDIRIDVSYDPMRFSFPGEETRVAGTRLVVHIPFSGDSGVFELHPSTFTFNPPRGRIGRGELLLTIEYPNDRPRDIDGAYNEFVGTVQQWLGWAMNDIDAFNNRLPQLAASAIAARRRRIEERTAHIARSSIPVGRPGQRGKTQVADAIVRRPAPKLPEARSTKTGVSLEPVLEEAIFDHILSVIRMQSAELLRSPSTYTDLDEEGRRDIFLAVLNTHYEGRGSAEAFNQSGKTDILIRFEDKNLFIAEFKFWSGQKGFGQALEQLFGYASWRDTKLALVIFIKEKGLTEIIEKAKEALEEHDRFVSWKEPANEVELRAAMSWPGDERRHADLNVFLVHTPAD